MLYTGRVKREYNQVSDKQNSILENVFANNYYPNKTTIKDLAQKVMLDERRVYYWFVRRRLKVQNSGAIAGNKTGTSTCTVNTL